jgi:hypothetical protein
VEDTGKFVQLEKPWKGWKPISARMVSAGLFTERAEEGLHINY